MNQKDNSENDFYTKEYFINLINENQKDIIIAMFYKDNIAISTELIIVVEDELFSYLGGTLSEYFNYKPNDYLKIEVIKWVVINSKKYYLLGGGHHDNDELYQYKKSFLPKEEDVKFYTGRKIINTKIYNKLTDNKSDHSLILNPNINFPSYR